MVSDSFGFVFGWFRIDFGWFAVLVVTIFHIDSYIQILSASSTSKCFCCLCTFKCFSCSFMCFACFILWSFLFFGIDTKIKQRNVLWFWHFWSQVFQAKLELQLEKTRLGFPVVEVVALNKRQKFLKISAPKIFGNFPVRHSWCNPF